MTTTDLEPGTYHARRWAADYILLGQVPDQTRQAIYRAICPYCRFGIGMSCTSSVNGSQWKHSVSAEDYWMCSAGNLRNHFYNVDCSNDSQNKQPQQS